MKMLIWIEDDDDVVFSAFFFSIYFFFSCSGNFFFPVLMLKPRLNIISFFLFFDAEFFLNKFVLIMEPIFSKKIREQIFSEQIFVMMFNLGCSGTSSRTNCLNTIIWVALEHHKHLELARCPNT
ncbi:unnamed protein product [Camellia sinensis]